MAQKPKWKREVLVQASLQMFPLLDKHGERLLAVLPPGAREGLTADVNELRGGDLLVTAAKRQAKDATIDVGKTLADGMLQISSWLEAIKHTYPHDKEMRKSFGVGTKVSSGSIKSVSRMMQTLLDAAKAKPEAAREAAILPEYVEKMQATLDALLGSDKKQESKKVDAKEATSQRIATQIRVERALERIVAAATMVFMGQPEAEKFAAILPRAPKAKKRTDAPEPQPSKPTA